MAPEDEFLKQLNEQFRKMDLGARGAEPPPEEVEARRKRELHEKKVDVHGVYEHPRGGAFVLLRDGLGRNLPIWIGQAEAQSITLALEGGSTQRPLTHELCRILLERLGARVDYVLVDDLYNNVFYAKLGLVRGEEQFEVDCRPSDAIAIGLRFRCPLYVADNVLEEGQIEITEGGSEPEGESPEDSGK